MGTEEMTRTELVNLIHRLLFAMDHWAAGGDGIPEEAWAAYREACEATGHNIPISSQPWVDLT